MNSKIILTLLLSAFLGIQSNAQNNFTDLKVEKQLGFNSKFIPILCKIL